jgi:hypothetical protein
MKSTPIKPTKKPSKKHSFMSFIDDKLSYTLTEEQQTLQNKHKSFLSVCKEHTGSSNKKIRRPFKVNVSQEIISTSDTATSKLEQVLDPSQMNDVISSNYIKMTPEGFAFLFTLEGCAKNLLLFLISMKVQRVRNAEHPNQFLLNKQVTNQFNDFCIAILGEPYKIGTIDKAITELKNKNAIITESKCLYYLNPLILAGTSDVEKNKAFFKYSILLLKKEKDSILDFYPKYK